MPSNPPTDVDAADSRCDNYPQYLQDTLGYAYDATDRVSLARRERHAELLEADLSTLQEADTQQLDDYVRLGVARGFLSHESFDESLSVLDTILESPRDNRAVLYQEVALLAAYTMGDQGIPDEGLENLKTFSELFEAERDRRERQLARGRLLLQADRLEEADAAFEEACDISDEAETRLDAASVSARAGRDDIAIEWLERAEHLARDHDDSVLLVDIDVWRDRLDGADGGDGANW